MVYYIVLWILGEYNTKLIGNRKIYGTQIGWEVLSYKSLQKNKPQQCLVYMREQEGNHYSFDNKLLHFFPN